MEFQKSPQCNFIAFSCKAVPKVQFITSNVVNTHFKQNYYLKNKNKHTYPFSNNNFKAKQNLFAGKLGKTHEPGNRKVRSYAPEG